MRYRLALLLLVLGLAGVSVRGEAQFLSVDARRIGMGGLSLHRAGDLPRYNAAYRAVPPRPGERRAKVTIPVPLGLIQFFRDHPISQLGDDPLFHPDSAAFNPIELANLLLHPPLFLEVKAAPTPTNDVEFTIGKNELIIDLGEARVLVPSDQFGFGGNSRVLDLGYEFRGVRVGVMGWMHHDVGFRLDDSLRAVLKDAQPVQPNTLYNLLTDATAQTGFAPFVGYAGRVWGDTARGIYLGAALRYYLGAAYGHADGSAGFVTGDTIFGSPGPVEAVDALVRYSRFGNSLGKGVGGDVGVVYASGAVEFGFGINDIGAKLTWSDTRVDTVYWDAAGDSVVSALVANHVESTTEIPVSYIANVSLALGTGTTVGGNVLYNGRRTTIHVGGEQRVGLVALRGGVARDQRKKLQLGWGAGLYLGSVSLDVGFWTHSNSFSDERGITMATSISIY
ncbi:MAG TPA: hypothetical protein VNI61_05825 [Gemmatimonadales bacterium]|nr:hypothetical protein [Gemmatimonadales bacterium]